MVQSVQVSQDQILKAAAFLKKVFRENNHSTFSTALVLVLNSIEILLVGLQKLLMIIE